ncbi:MAG: phosphoglycerate kinase [Deltaproteobacteria bacterium]|nr:phosphoglycerate kinase [Deltaproteobacteria bacterium]MCB9478883.1 phosphoglycerate kinase [Deltaproteobacteria bacterium]MCB9489389.1 phosphoglycerate kinase [Deltaproteobacteria bacterium]
MAVKYIDEVELTGKRVFIRADLNVPLDDDRNITDDTRIREVLPTVRYALRNGGRVILASHLGRPKGTGKEEKYSLAPVGDHLAGLLDREVIMAPDVMSDGVKQCAHQLKDGEVLLLDNLRFAAGETKNDPDFADDLASLTEVYVNDAFGASHRAHASIDALPRRVAVKCAGFLMRKELQYFQMALDDPARPVVAILGGAKVSDKIPVIENLLDRVNAIVIGGAMAYTFLAQAGENVGKSLVEAGKKDTCARVVKLAREKGVDIHLPVDHVAATEIAEGAAHRVVGAGAFQPDEMGLDIGPETREKYAEVIGKAKTIIWNGPMGVFEIDEFAQGTFAVAKAVAAADALSVVGGGDSVSAVHKAGVADKISHISTGGGASLELLEGKVLPGIAALETSE